MPTEPNPADATTGTLDSALRTAIAEQAAAASGVEVGAGDVVLSVPRQAGHGDLATNVAMMLAKRAGRAPRELAEAIVAGMTETLGDRLAAAEVAGPGFINLSLGDPWLGDALARIVAAGERWGGGGAAPAERINVEFVSANPTGPMHIGHARNAAYGDALSRLLAFHGHDVEREFYVNDFGSQVKNLGASIGARARGEEVPEDGYKGDYVQEIADAIPGAGEMNADELAAHGVEAMLERTKGTLRTFGVSFDSFFSERSLHEGDPSAMDQALGILRGKDELQLQDGAWWLRTEQYGDDKDRVVIRANGEPTYYASDLAYMRDKLARGYDRLVMVLGADHHGYIGRMKAAMASFGADPARLELLIMQLVHLVENGERARMSKRAGQFVTVEDLIDEIGADASRWFLLNRSHDTTVELDVALARKESSENPVYYVQYAHARCCSVLERAPAPASAPPRVPASEPVHPAERALILKLGELPDVVEQAAARRAPHRIATYALELAQVFTAFYRDCKIAGAPGDGVQDWRASLTDATRTTLATALGLLGVAAPARMERRDEDGDGL